MKSKYTPEFRDKFVALCIANNGNVEGTARDLHVPPNSAHKLWRQADITVEVNDLQKKKFVRESWETVFKILREIKRRLRSLEPDRLRAYNSLLQTLYEKQSHAQFEPTVRTEKVVKKQTLSAHSRSVFINFRKDKGLSGITPTYSPEDLEETRQLMPPDMRQVSAETAFKRTKSPMRRKK